MLKTHLPEILPLNMKKLKLSIPWLILNLAIFWTRRKVHVCNNTLDCIYYCHTKNTGHYLVSIREGESLFFVL